MEQRQQYNIIIADDHQLFIDGLLRILEDEPALKVMDVCNNGRKLIQLINREQPDLVMLDIQMPGINGLEVCRMIREKMPDIRIVFLSMFDTAQIIEESRDAGANGFVSKTTDAGLLKSTLKEILDGKDVFLQSPSGHTTTDIPDSPSLLLLSKREKEIIGLIRQGYISRAIAAELAISEYTVETHRKNIFRKLQISSVAELLALIFDQSQEQSENAG